MEKEGPKDECSYYVLQLYSFGDNHQGLLNHGFEYKEQNQQTWYHSSRRQIQNQEKSRLLSAWLPRTTGWAVGFLNTECRTTYLSMSTSPQMMRHAEQVSQTFDIRLQIVYHLHQWTG